MNNITLSSLSVNDINVIFAGLGKLPMEVSVDLWLRLKQQAETQMSEQTVDKASQE